MADEILPHPIPEEPGARAAPQKRRKKIPGIYERGSRWQIDTFYKSHRLRETCATFDAADEIGPGIIEKMTIEDRIREMKDLCNATTNGPWRYFPLGTRQQTHLDHEFAINARTHLPRVLDALQVAVDALRGMIFEGEDSTCANECKLDAIEALREIEESLKR